MFSGILCHNIKYCLCFQCLSVIFLILDVIACSCLICIVQIICHRSEAKNLDVLIDTQFELMLIIRGRGIVQDYLMVLLSPHRSIILGSSYILYIFFIYYV